MSRFILETIQDRAIVTMEDASGAIFNDLEWSNQHFKVNVK